MIAYVRHSRYWIPLRRFQIAARNHLAEMLSTNYRLDISSCPVEMLPMCRSKLFYYRREHCQRRSCNLKKATTTTTILITTPFCCSHLSFLSKLEVPTYRIVPIKAVIKYIFVTFEPDVRVTIFLAI